MGTWLIVPDQHAISTHSNERADYLAKLTIDLKPDVVYNMGDAADMPSLSSYDKGKRSFHGKSYRKDIDAHLEFQERWWEPVKRTKKRMPFRVFHEGNHEARLEKALDLSPELVGTIGFKDFKFEEYYDEIIRYSGGYPGVYEKDGILSAHFMITGISGRPMGGEHPAYTHLMKVGQSTLTAHSHLLDYCTRRTVAGKTSHNLVAGVYQDYKSDWAGPINELWRPGVAVLRNVEDGRFDLQWISLESLKKEYSSV